MDILRNPFYVLSASPLDSRATIKASFDALSLKVDQNWLQEAQSALTNPRKRLAAELSWLPGVDPRLYPELLKKTQLSAPELLVESDLPPLARANLLTSALQGMIQRDAPNVALWVLQIARDFEKIDAQALLETVNAGRKAARFALVSDLSLIEDELREKRGYFRQALYAELKKLATFPEISFALTRAAESATDVGKRQGPVLLDDLIDAYEVDAQKFLDEEEKTVKNLVERLRAGARRLIDSGPQPTGPDLQPIVNELISALKQWDFYAQPIQVSARSRGLGHPASVALGTLIRCLAVDLSNTYARYDLSMQLTRALQTVFAEVEEVAEQTAEDAQALSEIERKLKRQNAQNTFSRAQNESNAQDGPSEFSIFLAKICWLALDPCSFSAALARPPRPAARANETSRNPFRPMLPQAATATRIMTRAAAKAQAGQAQAPQPTLFCPLISAPSRAWPRRRRHSRSPRWVQTTCCPLPRFVGA